MTPDFEVNINGTPIRRGERGLIACKVTDRRAFIADQVELEFFDPGGTLAIPEEGATLSVAIGYLGEILENKGDYIVDGNGFETSPDTIRVTARSANLKASLNDQKSRSFKTQMLGDILKMVAAGHGLEAEINQELAALSIRHLDQTNESDGHLIARLGAMFGAVATIKDGRLVFTPLSRGNRIIGAPSPTITLRRSDCHHISYDNKQRHSEFAAIIARYHDIDMAKTMRASVPVPNASGDKVRILPQTYPDEIQARAAAIGELRHLSDASATVEIQLRTGIASIIPETRIRFDGVKGRIDGIPWVVDTVKHALGDEGFQTDLSLVPRQSV